MGKAWRGYIFSRKIGTQVVPQRVQNLVVRTCAESHDLIYLLSATEYYMENCYMMLKATLDEMEEIEGIIFYSIRQLPSDFKERKKIYDRVLDSKKGLRFALEDLALFKREDINTIEDLIACMELSSQALDLDTCQNWLN